MGGIAPRLSPTVVTISSVLAYLRACQLLLGHTKLESTVRFLGVEVDNALELSEALEL